MSMHCKRECVIQTTVDQIVGGCLEEAREGAAASLGVILVQHDHVHPSRSCGSDLGRQPLLGIACPRLRVEVENENVP
eukprot:scaffold34637_cov112-Isochrysis_galbana.AAC.3